MIGKSIRSQSHEDVVATVVVILSRSNNRSIYLCDWESAVYFSFGELHSNGKYGILQSAFENKVILSWEGISLVRFSQTFGDIQEEQKKTLMNSKSRNTSSDISLYNLLRYAWFKVKLCMQNFWCIEDVGYSVRRANEIVPLNGLTCLLDKVWYYFMILGQCCLSHSDVECYKAVVLKLRAVVPCGSPSFIL